MNHSDTSVVSKDVRVDVQMEHSAPTAYNSAAVKADHPSREERRAALVALQREAVAEGVETVAKAEVR